MKVIERTINGITIGINPSQPNEVFFEEDFIALHPKIAIGLSPTDLCELISKQKYTPMLMSWELLDKCSFSCPFCYIVGHSKNKIVRFSDMKRHIDDLIDLGLLYCTLTGGEATLHPDFIQIYSYLKKKGVIVEIYTNGSLISEKHVEVFKKLQPFKVEVSIYGLTQATFSYVTGTSKYDYQTILDNILELKRSGINVVCKTPINKTTAKEFDDIRSWCKNNDVKFYYSTEISNGYDGENLKDFSVEFSDKVKYDAQKISSIYAEYPEEFANYSNKEKTCYTCGLRRFGLHINSAFELMPCSETHFAETKTNIMEHGISIALNRYRSFVDSFIGRPIIGCTGCEASPTCKMCAAKADVIRNEDGVISDFKVSDKHCEKQRQNIRSVNEYLMTIN